MATDGIFFWIWGHDAYKTLLNLPSHHFCNSQKLRVVSKTMCHELERAHINSSNMGNGAVSSDDTRKPFVYAVIRIVMGDVKNVAS